VYRASVVLVVAAGFLAFFQGVKMKYADKFKDPRWQKKRLEILNRDKFTCQICGDDKSTLHVHHRYYTAGKEPWDYPNEAFVVLCEDCHEEEGTMMKGSIDNLMLAAKMGFMAGNVQDLAIAIHSVLHYTCYPPDVAAGIICWNMSHYKAFDAMANNYFAYLSRTNRQCLVDEYKARAGHV